MVGDKLDMECMKVEVACLYYLQLPTEKRSRGRHILYICFALFFCWLSQPWDYKSFFQCLESLDVLLCILRFRC